ncbi:MAG TPA: O-antigen ligase family protein [Gemmatimonadaceae bacterium]|nr:O-antigen ligase family protein [Gemmatimonadaceae bacterium]
MSGLLTTVEHGSVQAGGGWLRWPLAALYSLGFFSITAVAQVSLKLGVPSRDLTIGTRGVILACALISIAGAVFHRRQILSPVPLALILAFWVFYTARLLQATMADTSLLQLPSQEYWLFAYGTCLFPFMAFSVTIRPQDHRLVWRAFLAGLIVTMTLIAVTNTDYLSQGQGRLGDVSGSISPIEIAYMGSLSVSLALYWLLWRRDGGRGRLLGPIVLLALGVIALLLGAGRGSVLAILACAALTVAPRFSRRKTRAAGLALGAICLFGVLSWAAERTDSPLFRRIAELADVREEDSSYFRAVLWNNAINQFHQSPLTGSGLEEEEYHSYPHNLVIEALMATGIAGGACFTIAALLAVRRSYHLIAIEHSHAWIGMVFVNYLVFGMFSSAIYNSFQYWSALAAVFAVPLRVAAASPAAWRPHLREVRGTDSR